MGSEDNDDHLYLGWQGGKLNGNIWEDKEVRSFKFHCRGHSKRFSWAMTDKRSYKSKEEARAAAEKYMLDYNEENDLIRNQWRYMTRDIVEVNLTQGKTMITNVKYLPLVESRFWHTYDRNTGQLYAYSNPNIQFHRLIIKDAQQVDHIDGNGLNNTEENLRSGDNKVNHNNRRLRSVNKTGVSGVYDGNKGKDYKFSWRENGKEKTRHFGFSKYGSPDKALQAAKLFAEKTHERIGNNNGKRKSNPTDFDEFIKRRKKTE